MRQRGQRERRARRWARPIHVHTTHQRTALPETNALKNASSRRLDLVCCRVFGGRDETVPPDAG